MSVARRLAFGYGLNDSIGASARKSPPPLNMLNPLNAAYYADHASQHTVEVLENVRLARDTYRVRFRCPEIARRIVPGQFVMLRLTGFRDPLLGRPLALYDTICNATGEPEAIDVVYLVKGKLTSRLVQFQPGQLLDVWGPLGNGFSCAPVEQLVMVAGGIGITPFLALGQEFLGTRRYGVGRTFPPAVENQTDRKVRPTVTLCYGARTAELFACVEDYERAGVDVRLCTDDGSRGQRGLVSELLRQTLAERDPNAGSCRVVCCGPEPMMEAVSQVAEQFGVPCEVSLETPMACGIGICFTCVAKIKDSAGHWDYKRTCVEGPVFDARCIEW